MGFLLVLGLMNSMALFSAGPALKIRVVDGRPVSAQVLINGKGPFTFLLDTGAQTNRIDHRLAQKLGLHSTGTLEVVTVAGSTTTPVAEAAVIRLGDAEARNQEILLGGLAAMRQLIPDVQGVLGQEFLSRFDYLLDLRARRIRFGPISTASDRVPFESFHGCMLIATDHGRLILDSGTDMLIVFSEKASGLRLRLVTSAGDTEVHAAARNKVSVHDREYLAPRSVIMAPLNGHASGLLPIAVFRSVYISNSGNYIIPNPAID